MLKRAIELCENEKEEEKCLKKCRLDEKREVEEEERRSNSGKNELVQEGRMQSECKSEEDKVESSVPPVPSVAEFGLVVDGHTVELQQVAIDVLLLDLCADVRLKQVFKVKQFTKPSERNIPYGITFSFPINDVKAGVYHFKATIAHETVITSNIVAKDGRAEQTQAVSHTNSDAISSSKRDRFEVLQTLEGTGCP